MDFSTLQALFRRPVFKPSITIRMALIDFTARINRRRIIWSVAPPSGSTHHLPPCVFKPFFLKSSQSPVTGPHLGTLPQPERAMGLKTQTSKQVIVAKKISNQFLGSRQFSDASQGPKRVYRSKTSWGLNQWMKNQVMSTRSLQSIRDSLGELMVYQLWRSCWPNTPCKRSPHTVCIRIWASPQCDRTCTSPPRSCTCTREESD